ncbi:unnamed protein product [Dicrocoelium dendriticum]|nr:unnamed protein product [Dicrocoelium dendriticum]
MSNAEFDRLLDEQRIGIERTDSEIKNLLASKDEYESLISKLEDLQKSFSKDACLPFSPKAFVMGHLVHTNEILAYLGGSSNYFAEMSTYEAVQLIRRRIGRIDVLLKSLEQQKRLIEDRLQYTSDFSHTKRITSGDNCASLIDNEEVEIREDYDSDAERKWRIEHARSRQREREELKQLPSPELLSRKVSFAIPAEPIVSSDDETFNSCLHSSSTIYFQHDPSPRLPVRTEVANLSTLTLAEAVDMQVCLGKVTAIELHVDAPGPTSDQLPPVSSLPIRAVDPPTRLSRFKADRLKLQGHRT